MCGHGYQWPEEALPPTAKEPIMDRNELAEAREAMLQTAHELRENANGDCSAIEQAIRWEERAAALPTTEQPSEGVERSMLHVVFDGPPSHESGRFVECETPDGRSVNAGEWHERADGLWELRIQTAPATISRHNGDFLGKTDDPAVIKHAENAGYDVSRDGVETLQVCPRPSERDVATQAALSVSSPASEELRRKLREQVPRWIAEIGPACISPRQEVVANRQSAMDRLWERIDAALEDNSDG
jgi:hypothetical protein